MPIASGMGALSRHASPRRQRKRDDTVFGERREVTAVFFDLVESTVMLTHSDLEDFQDLISEFQEQSAGVVRALGGTLRDTFGDGAMAFFGYREPAEDSATAAIHAGLDIIRACGRLAAESGRSDLHVRIGIATSELIVHDSDAEVGSRIGIAPVLASRLQSFAQPDTIVVSERTRRLARRHFGFQFLGAHTVKGFEQQHKIWSVKKRIVGATRFLASGRLSERMVGREAELRHAIDLWQLAAAGRGQTLILSGEAGIGKSRLAYEVLRNTRKKRSRQFVLQCSIQGKETALSPLIELVRSAASSVDDHGEATSERISEVMHREGIFDEQAVETIAFIAGASTELGTGDQNSSPRLVRERIFDAVDRCIENWLEVGPIIIAIEDVHWIDPTTKDLLGHLIKWIRDKSVLLLMTTREAVQWTETDTWVTLMPLATLPAAQAEVLISKLWHGYAGKPPASVLSLIYQRTNGVPLYLEELSQWLNTQPRLDWVDWKEVLSHARITSLETILSARLTTLGPAKAVLQAASVIGPQFDDQLLRVIMAGVKPADIAAALEDLVAAHLIVRRAGSSGYAFRHSLIQETIYSALLRKTRSALHQKIFLATLDGMRATTRAGHAELAGLTKDAAALYISAAKESFSRSALMEARQLLERALRILIRADEDDERERLELLALAALGPVLINTEGTRSPDACKLYERAVVIARRRPVGEQVDWFPIYWGWWYTGADFGVQRLRAQTVLSDLHAVHDVEVRLQVHHCVWAIDFNTGHHETCITAVDAGLALYQRGGGRKRLTLYGGHDPRVCGLGQKGLSLWLTGQPREALASVEEAITWARKIRHVGSLAHAYDIAAMLHRYRSDYDALRKIATLMRRLAHKHRMPLLHAKALIFNGWCVACQGNPRRGREIVEEGLAKQREIGTREDFPVYSEMLAQILQILSESDAAITLLDEAIDEAERTGHRYWLPELYRRRALLAAESGEGRAKSVALMEMALAIALEQNASTLFLRTWESAQEMGIADALETRFKQAVAPALESVEPGGELADLIAAVARDLNHGATG